ncbi:hypothetical protein WA171_005313 [Blastocystis sp. BT1]
MMTGDSASTESFLIVSESSTLFSSPEYGEKDKNMQFVNDTCLNVSANHIYTLVMRSNFNDGWRQGAWISLYDINDNIVFKNSLSGGKVEESYLFALYSPINKNDTWRYSDSYHSLWNTNSFNDNQWISIILGSFSITSYNTQYFRKSFNGVTGMASIDIQFYYSHGIIAYINGIEVFKDNMPQGVITHSTLATNSYSSADYRGIILPAVYAGIDVSILAVELHFMSMTERLVDFNCFISCASGITESNICSVFPHSISASGTFASPENAFNFDWFDNAVISSSSLPAYVIETFFNVIPSINSIRFFTWNPSFSPTSFTMAGSVSGTSSWTTLLSQSDQTYNEYSWKQWSFNNLSFFKSIRFTVSFHNSDVYVRIQELQFMTCNPDPVSLPASSFFLSQQPISLTIDMNGITNCMITPPLPQGLILNPSSCTISGSLSSFYSALHTIIAISGLYYFTRPITLTILVCSESLSLHLIHSTQSTQGQGFTIRNTVTNQVLKYVSTDDQLYVGDTDYAICSSDPLEITLSSSTPSWSADSYIYLYQIHSPDEEELLLKARYDSLVSHTYTFSVDNYKINRNEQWYYRMSSIPDNWFDNDLSGWNQANRGTFPQSSNQIQLYKKIFNLDTVNEVSSISLNIRYLYGCLVYLNGHQLFSNHLSLPLTPSRFAIHSYSQLLYRSITLPPRLVDSGQSTPLLQQGSNVIAIAIIAVSANQRDSLFDASLRFIYNQPLSHISPFTVEASNIIGDPLSPFDGSFHSTISSSSPYNSLIITLPNDRRDWINTLQIRNDPISNSQLTPTSFPVTQFQLYGRNSQSEQWTLLTQVREMKDLLIGDSRPIFFINNIPFNQFMFANFSTGFDSQCSWTIQSLTLSAYSILNHPSPLSYPSSIPSYNATQFNYLSPLTLGYYDFSITPSLPSSLHFDPNDGWIIGSFINITTPLQFSISATRITGGSTTVVFSFTPFICPLVHGLITLRFHSQSYQSLSWNLFQSQSTLIASSDPFLVVSGYHFIDLCLDQSIYTFKLNYHSLNLTIDSNQNLISSDDSSTLYDFSITINEIEIGMGIQFIDNSFTYVFSTNIPFQMELTQWKVLQNDAPHHWNSLSFDDSSWNSLQPSAIPPTSFITTFIRKSFSIPSLNLYQVLNVKLKYTGGVVVYFNAHQVARFNIAQYFDQETESILIHDASLPSHFHIILSTLQAIEGLNLIAFEIHRPFNTPDTQPVVFDAAGVYGVDTCSILLDSYSSLSLSNPQLTPSHISDPFFMTWYPNTPQTHIDWTVDNLEGSKWNSFYLLRSDSSSWGFSIHGFNNPQDQPILLLNLTQTQSISTLIPLALAGFPHYRWQLTSTGSNSSFASLHLAYCKPTGSFCSGEGDYPSVADGQISPALCPSGYSYRQCTNGVLGPIIGVDCSSPPPSFLHYSSNSYLFILRQYASTGIPSFINTVQRWYLSSQTLPDGLILDSLTGEIHGTPTNVKSITSYSINAENGGGSVSVSISIEIISSLISYPQTNLIIGQGLSFSITPNLTKVSTISTVSGSLPNGLSINPSTGVISGSPSQLLSSQSVTIEAMSGTAIETVVLSFTVITPVTSFSYPDSTYVLTKDDPFSISPTVIGDDLSFSVVSGFLPIGLSFNPSNGMISGTPSQSVSSQPVTIKAFNQVLTRITSFSYPESSYTLSKYDPFSISPSINGDELSFSIISGSLPTGLSFNPSNGMISGTPSQSVISQSVTIKAFNDVSNQTFPLSFTVLQSITSFSYPNSTYVQSAGESFSISPTVDGDELSFSIISGSLPTGLSLNPSNGMISGIPSKSVSSQSVTIKVSNDVSAESFTLIFTIRTSISLFAYSQALYILSKDDPFSISPTVIGDDLSFSISSGSLPTGLSLNSSNGMISGIPSQFIISQSVTIKAFNEVSNQTFPLSFKVLTRITSFSYPNSTYVLSRNDPFSISPSINGDDLSFSTSSGSLPTGLSLNSTTGMISGTPSQFIISQSVTIKASNDVSNDKSFSLSFTVLQSITSFSYPNSTYVLSRNDPFSISPSIDGDDLSFSTSSGSLPTGLSLNPSTGVISGIPSEFVLSQSVTIKASNDVSNDKSFSLSFTVLQSITSFSYPDSTYVLKRNDPFSISPTVDGYEPSFSITSGSLPIGLSFNPSNGMISGTPSQFVLSQSVTIKAFNDVSNDKSFSLSFTVLQSITSFSYPNSTYTLSKYDPFSISPSIDGDELSFSIISGSLPTGLSFNPSNGMISGTPSQSVISQSVTIKAFNEVSDQPAILIFTVLQSITSFSYPESTYVQSAGESFSISPTVDGDELSFSIISGSLPTGLSLNPSNGMISGIPSKSVSSQSVTIKVSNDVSAESFTLIFTIRTSISLFAYSQALYILSKDDPFSISPTVIGDDLSFSISSGSLPTGLSLNPSTGVISGIPSQSVSSQSVTIIAFNEVSNQTFPLSFTVLQSITSFSYPKSSLFLSIGESFSISPTVDGDQLSFSIISGSLPTGLSLNSTTGMISGIPSQFIISQSVTIKAFNDVSNDKSFSLSFTVITSLTSFSYPKDSYTIALGESYSVSPSIQGTSPSFSIISGSLPTGLSLNPSTGIISGIPSQFVLSQSVTIEALNAVSNQTFPLSFTVLQSISLFAYPESTYVLSTGESFSTIPSVNGYEPSFSIISGSLPTGLSLNSTTGVIDGIPSEFVLSQSVTIKASNDVNDKPVTLIFKVLTPITSFSYPNSTYVLSRNDPFSISPTVDGYEPSFSIISGSLPTGLFMDSSTGMISGIPSRFVLSRSVTIKAFNEVSNQTFPLSFKVLTRITSFSYPDSTYVLSRNDPFSISPSINGDDLSFSTSSGSLPTGLSLNSTTGMISGIPSQFIISQSVTIKVSNDVSNDKSFSLSFTVLQSITSFSYPNSTYVLKRNDPFSISPTVDGDDLSFSITSGSLPIGLSFNPSNGMISGTPSQFIISQSVTIKVSNDVSNDKSFSLSFTVLQSITSFSYPNSTYVLKRNDPFSISPTVDGDDLSFSIISGSLPVGLSFNPSNGMILGTPSQSVSSQVITIKVSNQVSDKSFSLSFTVQLIPSSLNYFQTPFIIQNNVYFNTIPYCQGDDLLFSIISGSLPVGLSINSSTGIISGTPLSSIPPTSITIQASNQVGSTQFTISIQVIIPLSDFQYSQFSFSLIKGQSFSISPIISGEDPLFTITSGTLPPGLSLNSTTGIISGIPSSTFPSTLVIIQASNQLGFIQTQLSFTVNALSTLTIILISLSILIILIILIIIILIILSKKKKHTLPKKSIEEVKSVEKHVKKESIEEVKSVENYVKKESKKKKKSNISLVTTPTKPSPV